MTLLHFGGFETGDTIESVTTTGTLSVQAGTVRTGAYALEINPATSATGTYRVGAYSSGVPTIFSVATLFASFYFRYATKPASNSEEVFGCYASGPAAKLVVRLTSGGLLAAYDSTGTTLLATGSTVLSANTWYLINVKCGTAAGSAGAWEVQIDGVSEISGTGTLLNSNNALFIFGKLIDRNSQTIDVFYDDWALDNAAYPGAQSTKILVPSANGNYQAWTVSSGASSHFTYVDEVPHNSSTDYLKSTANTQAETEAFTDTAAAGISGTVNAVRVLAIVLRDGASNGSIKVRARSGSTDSDSAAASSTNAYAERGLLLLTDPATSAAWTLSGIDGLEGGLVEQSTNFTRMTAVYGMVNYVSSVTMTPAVGSLAFTANAPKTDYGMSPANVALSLAGFAPNVAGPGLVTPNTGTLSLTGFAPFLNLQLLTGTLSLTGFAPVVTAPSTAALTPNPGSLSLTGYAPSFYTGRDSISLSAFAFGSVPSPSAAQYTNLDNTGAPGWNVNHALFGNTLGASTYVRFFNWRIAIGVAPGAAKSWLFELYYYTVATGLVNTGLSVTISGASATTGNSGSTVVSIPPNAILKVKSTPSASAPAGVGSITWSYRKNGPGVYIYTSISNATHLNQGQTVFIAPNFGGISSEQVEYRRVPTSGTVSYAYANSDVDPVVGAYTITFRVNKYQNGAYSASAADTGLTFQIPAGSTTGSNTSVSVHVDKGDVIGWSAASGASSTTGAHIFIGYMFTPDNPGESLIMFEAFPTAPNTTTPYAGFAGPLNASQSLFQVPMSPCVVRALTSVFALNGTGYAQMDAGSVTITIQKAGIDTDVTITGAPGSIAEATPTLAQVGFNTDDLFGLHYTVSADAPANSAQHGGIVFFIGDVAQTPNPASLSFSTFAGNMDLKVQPGVGALALTGYAGFAAIPGSPLTGTLDLTAYAPNGLDLGIKPNVASLALTGLIPGVQGSFVPTPGTLTLTGYAPTVSGQAFTGVQILGRSGTGGTTIRRTGGRG